MNSREAYSPKAKTTLVVFVVLLSTLIPGFSAPPRPKICGDEELESKLKDLMARGVEDAFREHVQHAFAIWMKDEAGQPERARTGILGGVSGYIRSREALIGWKLPRCIVPEAK